MYILRAVFLCLLATLINAYPHLHNLLQVKHPLSERLGPEVFQILDFFPDFRIFIYT
jgi:hypothetical protein